MTKQDTTFGDALVQLWEEHEKRGTSSTEQFRRTNEAAFRGWLLGDPVGKAFGVPGKAREMFGGLADLLEWTVETGFRDGLTARAEIPGYKTNLEWSPDITGLYQFYAITSDPGGGITRHLIDGRLKLGAIFVKWGLELDEEYSYDDSPYVEGDEEEYTL